MLNGIDLFSGIGGISLALKQWVRPLMYCEIDTYCQGVLLNRQSDGLLFEAPIWTDITSLRIRGNGRNIDIVYGGFPCQDISVAGAGRGLAGKQSGLFYEIVRICRDVEPRFIFLENVPAIISRGGTEVVREIAKMGYDCRWCVISAASVGAPHIRERWFLLAHSNRKRFEELWQPKSNEQGFSQSKCCSRFWEAESPFCGVADGVSDRVGKLRALGNAVVPQQAKKAFEILMGLK